MSQRITETSHNPQQLVHVVPNLFGLAVQCGDSKMYIPKELLPDLLQALCTWLPVPLDQLVEIKELIRHAVGEVAAEQSARNG